MKKLALTLTVTLACVAAFAQGKVRLINDSLHLVYFTTDTGKLLSTDTGKAGFSVPDATAATLTADLWGGTSSTALVKVGSATFTAGIDGTINSTAITLPTSPVAFPAGTPAYFQVQVYSTSAGSYAAASATSGLNAAYWGESYVFQTTPSSGVQYASIVQNTSIAFSTWLPGTYAIPTGGSA